jgi:hypothetical protein
MPEETPPEGGFKAPESQEALERILGERVARERARFADYDDLKAKAARLDEVDKASKTEVQKLQDEIKERDGKLAALPGELRKQVIRFASQASKAGFIDPEDALMGIDADLADNDAVKTALADLAERKPHLVRTEKAKTERRPKPLKGDAADDDLPPPGKERAAAALRQFSATR